jgi:hypothetical protein
MDSNAQNKELDGRRDFRPPSDSSNQQREVRVLHFLWRDFHPTP